LILTGEYGSATGYKNTVSGKYGHAFGAENDVTGEYGFAIGASNTASGAKGNAFGYLARAVHDNTFVWNSGTTALSSTNSEQALFGASNGFGVTGPLQSGVSAIVSDTSGNVISNYTYMDGQIGGVAPIIEYSNSFEEAEMINTLDSITLGVCGPTLTSDKILFGTKYDGTKKYFEVNETGTYSFTGSHNFPYEKGTIKLDDSLKNHVGKIVEVTGKVLEKPYEINQVKPFVRLCSSPKSKKVIGVITDHSDQEINGYTKYDWEDGTYNKRNNYIRINSIGEGQVLVCDETGPIESGSLICSSSLSGYGMCQLDKLGKPDDIPRSFTVGKCLEDCNFDDEKTFNLNGKKCRIIACIYSCG